MKSQIELPQTGNNNLYNLQYLLHLNRLLKNKHSSIMPLQSLTWMPLSFLKDGMLMSMAISSSTSPRWMTTGR